MRSCHKSFLMYKVPGLVGLLATLAVAAPMKVGQLHVDQPQMGNVYDVNVPVVFPVRFKSTSNGQLTIEAVIVDYFKQTVWHKQWDWPQIDQVEHQFDIQPESLGPGYYELNVTMRCVDASGSIGQTTARVTLGIVPYQNLTAAQARQQGHRIGMKMFGPNQWQDTYALMNVCRQIGLQWTRENFRKNIDKLAALQTNIVFKVEGIPPQAYDEKKNGPRDSYRRRHFDWFKASIPLKEPYQKWLEESVAQ